MHSLEPYPAAPDLYLVPVVQYCPVYLIFPYPCRMSWAEGADYKVIPGEPDLRVRRRYQPVLFLQDDIAGVVAAQSDRSVAQDDGVGLARSLRDEEAGPARCLRRLSFLPPRLGRDGVPEDAPVEQVGGQRRPLAAPALGEAAHRLC